MLAATALKPGSKMKPRFRGRFLRLGWKLCLIDLSVRHDASFIMASSLNQGKPPGKGHCGRSSVGTVSYLQALALSLLVSNLQSTNSAIYRRRHRWEVERRLGVT